MVRYDGAVLRAWRRARGWDAPELARRFRQAADGAALPEPDSLKRMIWRWERKGLTDERYELLYARTLGIDPDDLAGGPPGMGRRANVEALPDVGSGAVLADLARDTDGAVAAGGEIVQAAAPVDGVGGTRVGEAEALEVMTWVTATNASDDAVAELARSADYLADVHARLPAAKVLREVLGVHRAVQVLLRGGRQRLAQTRELLRTDSVLLAHACLLLGDLG